MANCGRLAILNHHFSNAERLSTLRGLNLCLGCFLTAFEVYWSSTLTFGFGKPFSVHVVLDVGCCRAWYWTYFGGHGVS